MKIELSHDILAQKVYERVSLEDKRLREVERLVRERYAFYQGEPKLTSEEVEFIYPYLKRVEVTEAERTFVEQSKRKAATRRIRRIATLGLIMLLLLVVGSVTVFLLQANRYGQEVEAQNREIARQKADLEVAYAQLDSINAGLALAKQRADTARNQAQYSAKLAKDAANVAELEAIRADQAARIAESARDTARQNARIADSLRRVALRQRAQADTLRRIAEQKARAVNLLTARQMAEQSLKIRRDPRLKALLAREAYRLYTHFRIDSLGNVYAGPSNTSIYQALYAALPLDLRRNRYSVLEGGEAQAQIRDLMTHGREVVALKGTGQTKRWTWNAPDLQLLDQASNAEPVGDQMGIYYALAMVNDGNLTLRLGDDGSLGVPMATRGAASPEPWLPTWFQAHPVYAVSPIPGREGWLLIGPDQVYQWSGRPQEAPQALSRLPVAGRWLHVQWHPEPGWLAGIDPAQRLHLWHHQADGATRFSFTGASYSCLTWLDTGQRLAAGRKDGVVELIDLTLDSPRVQLLRGHEAAVTDLAYHAGRQSLATSSRDRSVQFWALTENNFQRTGALRLSQNQGMVLALNFSPDGEALLTGDNEGILQVWPLAMSFWYERLLGTYPLDQLLRSEEAEAFVSEQSNWASQALYEALPEYRTIFSDP